MLAIIIVVSITLCGSVLIIELYMCVCMCLLSLDMQFLLLCYVGLLLKVMKLILAVCLNVVPN